MQNVLELYTFMEEKVISILAEHLGIEPEDITMDDTFVGTLHMNASDLADFAHILESHEIEITAEQIAELETVGELVEFIATEHEI